MIKVLIAEDDALSQRFVAAIVDRLGHAAFVSPNGRHAWDALRAENRFDLVITDMMMPGMDGTTLIRSIRDEPKLKDLPIIIMSAFVGMSDITNLLNIGATWFVPKPLERDLLEDYISRSLKPQHPV